MCEFLIDLSLFLFFNNINGFKLFVYVWHAAITDEDLMVKVCLILACLCPYILF